MFRSLMFPLNAPLAEIKDSLSQVIWISTDDIPWNLLSKDERHILSNLPTLCPNIEEVNIYVGDGDQTIDLNEDIVYPVTSEDKYIKLCIHVGRSDRCNVKLVSRKSINITALFLKVTPECAYDFSKLNDHGIPALILELSSEYRRLEGKYDFRDLNTVDTSALVRHLNKGCELTEISNIDIQSLTRDLSSEHHQFDGSIFRDVKEIVVHHEY